MVATFVLNPKPLCVQLDNERLLTNNDSARSTNARMD